MLKLFLLFTLVPTLELFLLLQIGSAIGPIYTLLVVVVTGIIGSWLARMEGWSVLGQLRDDLQKGIPPASRATHPWGHAVGTHPCGGSPAVVHMP